MRGLRFASLLMLIGLTPGQKALVGPRSPVGIAVFPFVDPSPSAPSAHSIPGGGRILFSTDTGMGVVGADGSRTQFGTPDVADGYWDPLHRGHILVDPFTDGPSKLNEYLQTPGGWRAIRRWPVGYGEFTQVSLDGRWFAYNVFVKGKMTGTIRVAGRDGSVRSFQGHRVTVEAWTPENRVILRHWDGSGLVVWDPFRDTLRPFTLGRYLLSRLPDGASRVDLDVSRISWSTDGRFYAAPTHWWEKKTFEGGVAIGSRAGGIVKVIPTGRAWGAPTWSPTEPEVAFVSSSRYRDPAASLHVFNAATGPNALIRRGVPDPYWVAWSPAGDWMLLDDPDRNRWLFVSRDGDQTVAYPWLGSSPRWAERSIGIHMFVC
jgi:hypothetical protein